MNDRYNKIIDMPHHVSPTRSRMSRPDRAAQFAPYSALSGYEDAVEETARLTNKKINREDFSSRFFVILVKYYRVLPGKRNS